MFKSNTNRIIFFGSFEFAVPTLGALARPVRGTDSNGVKAGYEIIAVVTNSDKPSGRQKMLTPPPVKIAATKLSIAVWQPKNLKIENLNLIENWKLKIENCDLGVVVGYNKIIPPEIFNLPRYGMLNIHPSLLPKYRGPSPVQTAILNGDNETGVTIMQLAKGVDDGDIIAQKAYALSPTSTSEQAHSELFNLGTDLLIKILPDYLTGKIKPQPQDDTKATYTHKFTTKDGEIKNTDTPEQAYNKIRAFNPEPGAYIWLKEREKKLRLKILETELANGQLKLRRVQLEGGRSMNINEFLAGHPNFKENLL